eukprot:TRINITY_DN1971_c0_g1_i1.p1 TRINITY_DN1971_c0_g1~~TRINITY_DN1971_c0_g1_i1.p1  ORF type:complete len:337 (-),score=46.45 TRINITY_DN1971_c0_g1_i1:35-1045(-)
MRARLLVLVAFACALSVAAIETGELCATDGSSYSVTVGEVTTGILQVQTNGCPNTDHTNSVGNNPNVARAGSVKIFVPSVPTLASQPYSVMRTLGPVGVALNGVVLFGPATGPSGGDAAVQECDTFDSAGGHSDPFGNYHHHVFPPTLATREASFQNSSCPLLGFFRDGFPILSHNTQCGVALSDLDECNGAILPDGRYAYFFTGPQGPYPLDYPADAVTGRGLGFPYSIGCFRGCVPEQNGRFNTAGSYALCLQSGTKKEQNALTEAALDAYFTHLQSASTANPTQAALPTKTSNKPDTNGGAAPCDGSSAHCPSLHRALLMMLCAAVAALCLWA